jgi:DNA-binding transcriptional ArsR family regulator
VVRCGQVLIVVYPVRNHAIGNLCVTVASLLPMTQKGSGRPMVSAPGSGDPFGALGDPNRREILRLLSDGDKAVQEIAAAMSISRPAVSRHLRLLKDAGMVAEQAAGTRRIYQLREQGMQAVQAYLEGIWGDAAARFRLLAENTKGSSTS